CESALTNGQPLTRREPALSEAEGATLSPLRGARMRVLVQLPGSECPLLGRRRGRAGAATAAQDRSRGCDRASEGASPESGLLLGAATAARETALPCRCRGRNNYPVAGRGLLPLVAPPATLLCRCRGTKRRAIAVNHRGRAPIQMPRAVALA